MYIHVCMCVTLSPPPSLLPTSLPTIPFCHSGARAFSFAFFGAGIGPIHLDNVGCFGAERFLVNCSYTTPRFDSHFEDAGVRCGARESRTYIHVCTCIIYDRYVYIVLMLDQFVITFCLLSQSHTHSLLQTLTHTHSSY